MKSSPLILVALSLTVNSLSQTYSIPGAEEQPAWVFPLWFEDGTGAKDTIYIAYDEEAVDFGIPSTDIIFGEDFETINTDTFNVIWDGLYIDKAYKVVVFKTITTPIIISFLSARLPLKITWDNNLFYSDDLPLMNNFPLPNAWALVHCGDNNFDGCAPTLEGAIVLTDAPDYDFWNAFATDSLWFNSDTYEFFINYLDFQIQPYSEVHNWGLINSTTPSIVVTPNITNSIININTCCSQNVYITNLSGTIVKTFANMNPGSFTINISDLPSGFYILSFSNENTILNTKILKL